MSGGKKPVVVLEEIQPPGRPVTVEERVRVNDDGSKTFDLDRPVKAKFRREGKEVEEEISSITLRRMNGGDALAIMNFKNEGDQMKQLFTRLTGKPVTVLELLDIEDFTFLAEVIESFLPPSLKNGKGSSA